MTAPDTLTQFRESLTVLMREIFERVQESFVLDSNTSLFETLATVSAEQASRPVSAHCASIAAQVDHTRFYVDLTLRLARGEQVGKVDWAATWSRTSVTPDEWTAVQAQLRATYQAFMALASNPDSWQDERAIGGAMGVLVHSAYHLGEIRQALCTVRG